MLWKLILCIQSFSRKLAAILVAILDFSDRTMISGDHPRFSCTSDMSLTIYGKNFSGPLVHTNDPSGTGVLAIRYIAENMVKSGSDKVTSAVTRDDVHWVLTVPAIWSDAAKQFMRTAAIEVIIKLVLVSSKAVEVHVYVMHHHTII